MAQDNLSVVQNQFRRQAEVYSAMPVVTDPAMLEFIVGISGAGPRDQVLDIASGPDFVTMAFAARCARAVGIDATDRFVARARDDATRRGLTNVTFVLGDVERMAFAEGLFDIVSCRFAFHHFPRPAAVLAEMKRVARPGGTLVIVDMNASEDAARADYHNRLERMCDPSHARAIPNSEFLRMFDSAGLELKASHERRSSYTVEEWIAHGAPPPAVAAEIRRLMEASIEGNKTGLNVRREAGELSFSHSGASYVLHKPA
jgi:ubiquinone/menaquinone biosynthesis C-methylase UbiE